MVLAHDSGNADYHVLGGAIHERSEEHVSDGLRWYYAASMGIALNFSGRHLLGARPQNTSAYKVKQNSPFGVQMCRRDSPHLPALGQGAFESELDGDPVQLDRLRLDCGYCWRTLQRT